MKTAADTFRANPEFKTDEAIMQLETGEALVSFLDEKGAPNVVERAKILFPLSQIGAISEGQRSDIIRQSRISGKYDTMVDRESAYELIQKENEEEARQLAEAQQAKEDEKAAKEKEKEEKNKKPGLMKKILKAVSTAITSTLALMLGTW